MITLKKLFQGLQTFIPLWSTQALSTLGSSMTSYALVLWSYQQTGSALTTSLLSVCSYAPYVLLSIFAGALSDRWNKKHTMLICDSFAAISTILVLFLLKTGELEIWHLYLINAFNGIMNTIQQPASDVTVSLLIPKEQYQRAGGLRSFSNSLVTILSPIIATAFFSAFGMTAVIVFDLATFIIAFCTLAFFIHIPNMTQNPKEEKESILDSAKAGLQFLFKNKGIFYLILFLAAINLTASMYNAALPAMLLSRNGGSKTVLALVTTCTGLANVAGSIFASFCPSPKNRVKVIANTLLFSMSTENFLLALGHNAPVWCIGAILGWLFIPIMSTNLEVILRIQVPVELQGRVYSIRNTFQFFTIPVGYLLGGFCVDIVFEPYMKNQTVGSVSTLLFGTGKGSGAAMLFMILGILGVLTCLIFRRNREIRKLEKELLNSKL